MSQTNTPAIPGVPGFLDPTTGKFTARIAGGMGAQQNAQSVQPAATSGIFFREDFQISVQNFDQPANSYAVCSVQIATEELNSTSQVYLELKESSSVAATYSGGTWSCDAPILTL